MESVRMAKEKVELREGASSFTFVGNFKTSKDSLELPTTASKSGKTKFVNTTFGVEITESGNIVYPSIRGNTPLNGGTINKMPRERDADKPFAFVEIPFDKRFEKEWIDKVQFSDLYRFKAGKEDTYFVDPSDYVKHLADTLENGQRIKVQGKVTYSQKKLGSDDPVYRNYEVTSVTVLAENDEETENFARLNQLYLVTEGTVDARFAKEIKEDGFTTLSLLVPQYTSSIYDSSIDSYVPLKETVPYPQAVKISNPTLAEKLFKVKGDTVRIVKLSVDVNEGYSTEQGEIVITKELQELIDMGVLTEEELQKDVTVRGSRVRELILHRPIPILAGEAPHNKDSDKTTAFVDNYYSLASLALPQIGGSEDDLFDISDEDDSETESLDDDVFADMFGE